MIPGCLDGIVHRDQSGVLSLSPAGQVKSFTKKGCDHGQCGACTVHVNRRRLNSSLTLAVMHDGTEITTIEGLDTPGNLHPMQAAFVACDGYQCGYCTSGQIMSAVALLKKSRGPDDAAVKELMSSNICRCGTYAGAEVHSLPAAGNLPYGIVTAQAARAIIGNKP
jgi:aerobic-type carbon monoxide dehydrogenase small subunit (CoxS/CutS family)